MYATFKNSGKDSLVFYRLEPKHKRLLITLLSSFNQVVAMTGDGVNDAPALKQADIGIAMGLSGTEVAKEAADLVLADDNFDSIVKAIEQGRSIYDNMKAFIRYMISSNIGEVVCIFLGSVSGVPDVFSSVQLLWVNLVTDGLPAMALSFNEPDQDIMIKPPRNKDEPLVDKWVFLRYLIIGTYVGLATIGIFIYWFIAYDWADYPHTLISYQQLTNWTKCSEWKDFEVLNPENFDLGKKNCGYFSIGKKKASSLSLSVLVIIEMFNSLNALSENNSLLDTGLFANVWLLLAIFGSVSMHVLILYVPGLKLIFATTELSFNDWMLVIGFSWPVLLIDEVIKFFVRMFKKNRGELNCWKTE